MQGYVLGATDGDHVFNSSGEVVIKGDATQNERDLSFGMQLMPRGGGVPRHVRAYWDELIYVLGGSGTVTLNDERVPIQKGATIFVPKGTSHGFENPDSEFVSPVGYRVDRAGGFRAISSRPGEPPKSLSRDPSPGDPPSGRSPSPEPSAIAVLMIARLHGGGSDGASAWPH